MSRIREPLPEYGTLIRWTVQEVINWLSENRIDCSKCFRDGGVDGNKLVNITEVDLNNIRCPKKYIREILHHVSRVSRPGVPARTGGGGYGVRSNQRQVPFNEAIHNQDDRSGSEDDCWDEDEFDSDFDQDDNNSVESYDSPDHAPVAPPRPNRREVPGLPREAAPLPASSRPRQLPARPPEPEEEEFYEDPEETSQPPPRERLPPSDRGRMPVPNSTGRAPPSVVRGRPPARVPDLDGPDEDYEDPDASIKVSNFHGGPLPTPPTKGNNHVPIGQRKRPPLPASPREPSDSESDIEEYEDPDSTVIGKAPPLPTGPRRPPPLPSEPEEEYEEPDATVAKKLPGQRRPLPPPVSSVPSTRSSRNRAPVPEEQYEDPVETVSGNQKPQPPPLSKIPRKPSTTTSELPSYEMPEEAPPLVPRNVPRKKVHEPIVQQEETYEIPDETDSAPSKMAPQTFNNPVEEEVYEVPDTEEDQDDYLDMEEQMPVSGIGRGKPDKGGKRAAMPLPGETKSHATRKGADRKAPVEPTDDNDEVKTPHKKRGVPVLPVVPNGVKGTSNHSPRQGRSLPPPPAVTPERREPPTEIKEPVKPATKSTPQKAEITEADLLRQKWYHGNIKRVDAEIKLKQLSIDGMYLIRKSSQGSDQPYTLQIFYRGKCYNLPIRRRSDDLFAVGKEEKDGERAFSSLLDLVNGFKQNILILSGGAETKLVKSLPKT